MKESDRISSSTHLNIREQMKGTPSKPLDHFFHPYMFVLKEGSEIQQDFLDYSLLLLQVGRPDTLHSPASAKLNPLPTLTLSIR